MMELNKSLCDLSTSIFEGHWFRKATPEYLQELLQDKQKLQCFQPNFNFRHLLNILEKEINRVREKLFHINGAGGCGQILEKSLPPPKGEYVTLQEKVFIPVEQNPNYNFIGRLLGPRGLTAKQLEQELQCKLMIRGKGSLRNKEKEDELRGKLNWEHLNDKLHINITVEDYDNRASMKLKWAKEAIEKFIEQGIKVPDGEDDIKKRQLMELAIINGTYRDTSRKSYSCLGHVTSNGETTSSSTGSTIKTCPSLKNSTCSTLPNYVSLSTLLNQAGHDQNVLNILPSTHNSSVSHNFNQSSTQILPIFDPTIMNILSSYNSTALESMLPLASVAGLYNLPEFNVNTNGIIGPLRLRNMPSIVRTHPYQMM